MFDNDYDSTYKFIQERIKNSIPTYEDGESPMELLKSKNRILEKSLNELRELATSAKRQSESAESIADSSKTQSELSVKQSNKADIKSWISIAIAAFCAFIELSVHHSEIYDFIMSILAK